MPYPNMICPDRISPIARAFLQFLPTPTNGGPAEQLPGARAIPDTILGDSDYYFGRFDMYVGSKDHVVRQLWHQRAPAKFVSHAAADDLRTRPIPTPRTRG